MLAGMEIGRMGIVGASGFLGGELARQASAAGWVVAGFSRSVREPDGVISEWREWSGSPDVSGLDAVVNLAGDPINKRWTESNKRKFRESRVGVTETVVSAIRGAEEKPKVLLNGSAVGIYGDRGDEVLDEGAGPGAGYLADLCIDWEAAAEDLTGVRVVRWRTGVVLGKGGMAWDQLRLVFSLGLGGRLGNGRQWMPWVHVEDLAGGMLHAIGAGLSGPVNGSAPEPERNAEFTRKVAAALHRPAFMHAPGWALKLVLDGFGGALLQSQRAMPAALLSSGFRFRFPSLESALDDLLA
jgi:uncharacterized protein (TIGR01777 family)